MPRRRRSRQPISLNEQRIEAVVAAVRASGARRVLDLGCGAGKLMRALLKEQRPRAGRRHRRVPPGAGGRRPPAAPGHDGAPPAGPGGPAPGLAHLPGPPARRLRRGGRHGGDRAPRPVPPRQLRAVRVRPRPARDGHRHHAQRRVQRAVRDAAGRRSCVTGTTASSGPGPSSPPGPTAWPTRHGYTVALSGHRSRGPRGGLARPRWRCSADDHRSRSPSSALVVLVGRVRVGQVDVRRAPLPARPRCSPPTSAGGWCQRRRERPGGHRRRLRRAALHRRQAAGRRPADASSTPPTSSPAPGSRSSTWPRPAPRAGRGHRPGRAPRPPAPSAMPPGRTASSGRHVLRNQRVPAAPLACAGCAGRGSTGSTVLDGEQEIAAAAIEREPLWNDRRSDHGPFDIIGDIHGCYDELVELLETLGYEVDADGASARHPGGRRAAVPR